MNFSIGSGGPEGKAQTEDKGGPCPEGEGKRPLGEGGSEEEEGEPRDAPSEELKGPEGVHRERSGEEECRRTVEEVLKMEVRERGAYGQGLTEEEGEDGSVEVEVGRECRRIEEQRDGAHKEGEPFREPHWSRREM